MKVAIPATIVNHRVAETVTDSPLAAPQGAIMATNHIRAWRELRGLTQAELGAPIRLDKTGISKVERGVRPLSLEEARDLARFLGITVADLDRAPTAADLRPAEEPDEPPENTRSDDLIDLFSGAGAGDGEELNMREPIDRIPRPPFLREAPRAFAVRCLGTSMEPRYFSRETLYVHPGEQVQRHDFVLVVKADGNAIVKRFLRRDDTRVELEQFNPPRKFSLPTAQIEAICRVVASSEPR